MPDIASPLTDGQRVWQTTSGEGAPIAVQYRALGFTVPLINNHGIGNQDFIKLEESGRQFLEKTTLKVFSQKNRADVKQNNRAAGKR